MKQYEFNRNQPVYTRNMHPVRETVTPIQASLSALPASMVTKLGQYINYWKGKAK